MKVLFLSFALIIGASALNSRFFPDDFRFGLATSAYQIEGGYREDGKTDSIWDDYVHTHPEYIKDKTNGDVACDSYHKYDVDISLLKDLKVGFYRMSISWTRILNGTNNEVNQKGIDYYLKIFQLLKNNSIEPLVTLFHGDLPVHLQELGGWTNPEIVPYFGEYARACFKYFGEYVQYWLTLNEPQATCFFGYGSSGDIHGAPGYDLEAEGVYLCAYTQVKAHALAYHIYQNEFKAKQQGKISLAQVGSWFEPASNNSDDKEAQELAFQFTLGLFANPIFVGNWANLVIERVGNRSQLEGLEKSRLPEFTIEEIDYIKGTYDFFGLNYYVTQLTKFQHRWDDLPGNASYIVDGGYKSYADPSWTHSNASTWLTVTPWGFRKILNWVYKTYNQPEIIVTENGWAEDGSSLNDTDRIDYIEQHLSIILDAIHEDGVNIKGYTHWSLLDNFEWASGYTSKFGVVSVNFKVDNRTRTPKSSYYRYQKIISSKCLVDVCSSDEPDASSMILPASTIVMLIALVFSYILA